MYEGVEQIVDQLRERALAHYLIFTETKFNLSTKQNEAIGDFIVNEKKMLLVLTQGPDAPYAYFKNLARSLWKTEVSKITIPLYIELAKIKNPFTELINEGLDLYGATKEQRQSLINDKPTFILILVAYNELLESP